MKPIQKIINGKVYNLQVPDNASELDIAKALANEVERLDPLKSGFSVSTNQPQVDIPDLPPIQSRPEDIEKLPTLEETIKEHGGSDVANKIVSPLIEDLGGALDVPKRKFQRNTQILGAMLNAPDPGDTTGQAVNRGIISRAIEGDNPSTGQYISKGVFQPEPNESFLKGLGRGGLQTSLDISSDPLLPLSFGKAGNLLLAGMGASHSIPALADIGEAKNSGEFGEKLASAGLGGLLAFHGLKGAMGEGPSFSDEVRNSLNPEGAFGLNTPTFEGGLSSFGKGVESLSNFSPKKLFEGAIPGRDQIRTGYLDQPMDVNVVDPDNIPGYRSQSEVDKEAANYGEIDPIEKRLRSAASYIEDPQMRDIAQGKLEEYLRTKKDPREMVREDETKLDNMPGFESEVFHGTPNGFTGPFKESSVGEGTYGSGTYFTNNRDYADSYARGDLGGLGVGSGVSPNPKIRSGRIKLSKPLDLDSPAPIALRKKAAASIPTSDPRRDSILEDINDPKATAYDVIFSMPHEEGITQTIKSLGYDGVVRQGGHEIVSYDPAKQFTETKLEYEKLGDQPDKTSERGALGPKKLPKIKIGSETFQPDKNQLDQLYELQNEIKSRRESGEDKETLLKEATERTRQILTSKPGEKYTDTIKELENLAQESGTDTREPVKILEQTHGVTVVQFRDGRKQAIPDEKLKDFNVTNEKEETPLFTEKDLVIPEKRLTSQEPAGETGDVYLEGFSEPAGKTLEKRSKTAPEASSEGSGPKPPARGRKLKNGGNIPPEPPNPNDKFYKDWTAKDWVRDIAQIPQSLRAGFDISAFRNNFFRIATRPELLKDHFKATFQAISSHEGYKKATAEINDPKNEAYLKLANDNRLNLVGEHAERSHEAGFGSKIAENIPVVGKAVEASERSYSAPINVVRFKTFKNLIDLHGGPENVDADTVSRVARYTNAMTGTYKGKGKIEGLIRATAGIPWSGRNIAGRAELVNPGFYKEMLGDPVLRKELARDLGGTVVLGSTALYLTSEALKKAGHKVKVYYHPTDSKFGSISVDGVNYNIWGGASQPIRLVSQLLAQEERTDKGITKLGPRGKNNKFGKTGLGQVETFFENKLAPVPKFIDESFIKKTDWKGDKITPLQSAKENLAPIPLAFGDLPDIYKDNPDQILPASLLSLLGMDVRPAYKKKSKGNTLLIQP